MTLDERAGIGPPPDVIGQLLDQAVHAINAGDLATAHDLAGQVLQREAGNAEAADLLATGTPPAGELRRLTIMSCDLVGSTELSERLDPEPYHAVVRSYRARAREIIEGRYDAHITSITGDGVFALFGYPSAHEDDAVRAVKAAMDVCRMVEEVSARAVSAVGEALTVRAAVHRGMVLIDEAEADVYGLAANVTARLQGVATPGRVLISDPVLALLGDRFDTEPGEIQTVRGAATPLPTHTVISERPASVRHRSSGPLVGRAAELDVLLAMWGQASRGEARTPTSVLITGEAGVGKSRLAAAAADLVRADRALVVELAGSPFHAGVGLHPVRRLLEVRSGIGPRATSEERLARLRQELGAAGLGDDTTALLAPVLGLSPEAGYDAAAAEGRKLNDEITEAAKRFVLACFGGGSGLLLVEDVQWFDESTVALLGDLLRERRGDLLVVLTSRERATVAVGTTIEVQPLSRDNCIELIDALDDGALDRQARLKLVDRSDGIPLYLEELIRGGGAVDPDPDVGDVPDVLYEPLVARLYSTAHGVPVAAAAAAIGREVDRELLQRAVDLPAEAVDAELEALVQGRVLTPTSEPGGLRFRHELQREVAYELQPRSQRRRLHGRVADLLVADAPPDLVDWPVVATHYVQAGRSGEAANAYAQASDRARRRGAIAEARGHLARAIDEVLELPDDRERMHQEVDLRLRRGFLAMSADGAGSAEAATDFARCLEAAMVDAQGDEMFSTLISLWAYHLARAELDRGEQVLDTLRGALTGTREYFRAANRAGYGMIDWFRGRYQPALSILEEALAELLVAEPSNDVDAVWFVPNDPVASMHTHLALARFTAGDTKGAEAQLHLTTESTAALPFPQGAWSHAYASWLTGWMLVEQGCFGEAIETADALVRLATRHGFDSWSMVGMTNQAAVQAASAVHSVDAEGASIHASSLLSLIALWQAVELRIITPFYLTTAAAALTVAGDTEAARDRLLEAIAVGEGTGMRFYESEARRRLALLAPDDATVIDGLESALALAREQAARPFELRIALDLDVRGASGGRAALEAAMSGFRPDAELGDLTRARARLVTPS